MVAPSLRTPAETEVSLVLFSTCSSLVGMEAQSWTCHQLLSPWAHEVGALQRQVVPGVPYYQAIHTIYRHMGIHTADHSQTMCRYVHISTNINILVHTHVHKHTQTHTHTTPHVRMYVQEVKV